MLIYDLSDDNLRVEVHSSLILRSWLPLGGLVITWSPSTNWSVSIAAQGLLEKLKHLHIGQNFPRQLLYDFVKTSIFLELRGHKIPTENKTVGFPEGMKEGSKGIPILFPHSWGLGGSCTVLTWTAPILASLVSSPFPAPWTLNRCTISPQVLQRTLHGFSATTKWLNVLEIWCHLCPKYLPS